MIGGCTRQPPTPIPQQTLRIGTQNTAEASTVFREILSAEPLLVLDWHGRAVPRLAEAWEWLDGGLRLSVRLRQDVKFQDGTPMTARAAAEILRRNIAKGTSEGFRHLVGLETPDERSLVFRLRQPDSFLVEGIAAAFVADDERPSLRTGPFKLVPTASGLTAERNTAYYRGTPDIARVEVSFYDTQRAVFAAIIRGAIDVAPEVNPESVEFLQGASAVETFSSVRPFYVPLVFNLRHPILRDPAVRRALSEAIDREEIVRQAMRGHARIADDPIWPAHWAYTAASRRHAHDPDAARTRLDAAGFPLRPAGPDAMASRFQLHCLFYNRDFQFERIAVLLQRQLEEVGVDLVLTGVDQETLIRRAGSGDFDTYVFQLTSGKSFDWIYRFWHSRGGLQATGYSGADAALDRLRTSRLDSDVRVAVADLRQRFSEDVPAAFLAWPETTRAVSARFDIGDPADPDVFTNLWRWRPASLQQAAR